ncbi:MAG: hypothetical protein Q8N18_17250 [Opitutaceae bacterium]|nr:hypothetical protein [Opitutaceae bacterium]
MNVVCFVSTCLGRTRVALALLVLVSVSLCTQAPGSTAAARQAAADTAWAAVGDRVRVAGDTKVSVGPVAVAILKAEKNQRAHNYRAAAQGARDFAAQYPEHGKAGEARKTAVLAELEGTLSGDKTHERAAVAAAAAFRSDKANPVPARYEVAHAMDRRDVSKKILWRPWYAHTPLAEQMLDRLHAEFGGIPEVYAGYLALAEHTNCDNGRDVALKLVQSSAPAATKAAAQRLLDRYALVRQPLDFPLVPTQGPRTTLAQLAGKRTVVVFYDGTRSPAGPPGLHDFRKNPTPDTRWVYIALGTPAALAPGKKPNAAPPGTLCVEPLGLRSPVAAQLRLNRLPFALVLDEQKRLSSYGRIDELPWMLSTTHRVIAR